MGYYFKGSVETRPYVARAQFVGVCIFRLMRLPLAGFLHQNHAFATLGQRKESPAYLLLILRTIAPKHRITSP